MLINEEIRDIKTNIYYGSRKTQLLQQGLERLHSLDDQRMTDANRNAVHALAALLEVKLATIMVFKGEFSSQKVSAACDAIDRAKVAYREARQQMDPNYISEADKFAALKESVLEVAAFVEQINDAFAKLIVDGAFSGSIEEYYHMKERFGKVRQREWAPYFPEVGGKDFAYISVQTELAYILNKKAEALSLSMAVGVDIGESAFRKTVDDYDDFDYLPGMVLAKGMTEAPICMVSTPFEEEFDVLLNANKTYRDAKRVVIQMDFAWLKKVKSNMAGVRNVVARAFTLAHEAKKPGLIGVYGLDALGDETRKGFFLGASDFVRMTHEEVFVAIHDHSGDMWALNAYQALRRDNAMVDADNKYLRLPAFEDVKRAMFGMEEEQLETIRKQCPFMGYVGFNRFVKNAKRNYALALEDAKSTSDLNFLHAGPFLDKLLDVTKILPYDWRWQQEAPKKPPIESGGNYDYDQIRDVSDDRMWAIISNTSFDVYQKCGELVRYCLLAEEDRSVWAEVLDDEQREARIKKAVRIVAYTMKVFYDNPAVEIVSTDEGGWGGLCCGGGATIKFKKSSITSIDWMMDAVVHELYHSLQHTVTDKNMPIGQAWYKRTYHISNERIETWRDNSGSNYIDLDDNKIGYWLQALEADARDFASLCMGDQVYHSHNSYR